jgi:UPF0148 protein
MTGKESDDKIQMITKLLEKGGTMLATHHDCGAPMFRYHGKIVCPVCDFQEKKEEQQQSRESSQILDRSPQPVLHISNIIANKIQNLTASLETETEPGRIKDKMECIERGVRILKLLREIG